MKGARTSSSRFFAAEAEDEVTKAIGPLPAEVALLVAGHTHGRRHRPEDEPTYLNSGTWTPVWPLPEGDIERLIDAIERDELPPSEAPRTVVEIVAGDGLEARLLAWDGEALS